MVAVWYPCFIASHRRGIFTPIISEVAAKELPTFILEGTRKIVQIHLFERISAIARVTLT